MVQIFKSIFPRKFPLKSGSNFVIYEGTKLSKHFAQKGILYYYSTLAYVMVFAATTTVQCTSCVECNRFMLVLLYIT